MEIVEELDVLEILSMEKSLVVKRTNINPLVKNALSSFFSIS